jgi:carboxyl-terminal processing protease
MTLLEPLTNIKKIIMINYRLRQFAILAFISFLSIPIFAQTDIDEEIQQKLFDNKKNKILSNVIISSLERAHYSPKALDDSLSSQFYHEYLKNIDRSKNFLLQQDVYELSEYEFDLDEQLSTDRLDFFNLSQSIITNRTKEVQKIYRELLAEPFDYTKEEDIELDPDKVVYAKSKEELKERWRKALKYQTISNISNALKDQTKAAEKSDTVTIKTFTELEIDARKKILKRQDDWFHRMIDQVNNTDRITIYENSLCAVFDPHSNYFPPKLKEDFDIRFSGQLEGIGATLSPKEGYIRIVDVVPGSPAWKTGELKKEDLIMKVAQGDEDAVDVYDMRLDDAVKMIRGPKGTEVRLTIKKPDGTVKIIPIIRDIVIREETYAKSCIINSKEKENFKVGYIYLPSFYTNFNDPKGRSCGKDMKKEVEKITKEGINDIIIDLRGNGGGSLRDAVEIAGLFIDQGPVVQRKSSIGQQSVLRDHDNVVYFDGNLVVLVSETSASASEILAAALQDYQRAVIVGSNSTFGKGTVQQFYSLDRLLPAKFNEYKSFGSLKITMEKFYRINGGATQLKGVIPDVILPTNYSYIDFGEKEMDFALPWDEIDAVEYHKKTKYIPNYQYISKKSNERVSKNKSFQQIDEYAKWVKNQREKTTETLNYDQFEINRKERKDFLDQFEHIGKDTLDIAVFDLKMDADAINADSTKRVTTDEWHDAITKDNSILESIYILEDLNAIRED